jgi:P4 family phage/plasmid primase-like protien
MSISTNEQKFQEHDQHWEKKQQQRAAEQDENPFTDDALARRFSARHADELRHVAIRSQWFKWNGAIWQPENTLLTFDLARRSCHIDAKQYGNGKPAASVLSAKTIAAVERLARADRQHAAALEQFDADDWLITAGASTIDLRTGKGRPPNPADYITRAAAPEPADAPHPEWSAFLTRVAPDPDLPPFLQRWCGYCLTGVTSEQKFVFGYGTGANGKSTFINTIAKILGDYATVADVATFIASSHERHPTDVAKLHGPRLVIAQETEKGRRWDEAKIKSLTGGDKMTARFMRQDFFDFVPKFKLFVVGNHKPHLDNVDAAMRRRLLLVPFQVQIPEPERDPNLPEKLWAERRAILRWMLDGCLEWQRTGLAPPKIVTDATDEYFSDQDTIKQWLEDCTEDRGPFAFTPANQLFASWRKWCDERSIAAGSAKALSDALTDRGFTRKRMGHDNVRGFARLTLKAAGRAGEAGSEDEFG